MKKIIAIALTLYLLLGLLPPAAFAAEEAPAADAPAADTSVSATVPPEEPAGTAAPMGQEASQGLEYTLSDDGTYYIVTGIGTCTDTELIIPATYNGLPVQEIGSSAFWYCSSLTSVTIPEGVTTIETYAFRFCHSLTSVTIPASVSYIGECAFEFCDSLTDIQVAADNDYYCSVDGVLYSKDMTLLHTYPVGRPAKTFAVPAGVSHIGHSAFESCDNLISVTLPDGVTTIGDSAFSSCWNLGRVTIPASVTSIGSWAFDGCSKLSSVTIPDGVTSIGFRAFNSCDSLTSVTIPDSVTFIDEHSFSYCDILAGIQVEEGNENYCSVDGVLYDKNMSLLHTYPAGKNEKNFVIPSSVTRIGEAAFSGCTRLTSITIPENVSVIAYGTFAGCSSLSSVTIPEGVTRIERGAFDSCRSLTSVVIPNGVTSIGDDAFFYCEMLTSVVIPNSVTSIGDDAFSCCEMLTSITIPTSVAYLGSDVLSGCRTLRNVIYEGTTDQWDTIEKEDVWNALDWVGNTWDDLMIFAGNCAGNHTWVDATCAAPKTCTSCGLPEGALLPHQYVDECCVNCGKASYSEGLEYALSDDGTYYIVTGVGDCNDSDLIIPAGYMGLPVREIGDGAFCGYELLTNIFIPDSVTGIGYGAFESCSRLTSVTIPDSVASIGNRAFIYCDRLTDVTIPNSVLIIGDSAFWNCSSLRGITIPNSVTSIGSSAFFGCNSLEGIWVDSANPYYCNDVQGVLFDKDKTVLIHAPSTMNGRYEIPSSVTCIDDDAFHRCTGLTEITIPSSVTRIGGDAFEWCKSLTSVTIPQGVASIGYGAFSDCTSLTSVTIPNGVTSIGYGAFSDCTNLSDIYFNGTEAQWNAIEKGEDWDAVTGDYTLHFLGEQGGQIVIESATVRVGDTVTLELLLQNNPGVMGLIITLEYDKTVLTLESVENGTLLKDLDQGVNLSWSADENCVEDGVLCTLTFRVAEDAPTGNYQIRAKFREASNEDLEDVAFEIVPGQLEVVDYLYGDANGDGVVNGKDMLLLRKYMANYDYDTDTSTVTVFAGADANGDGVVNGKDMLLMRKYMANYDYDTGTSTVVLGPSK